ncbi:MAG: DUF4296 domain-containing protein [Flavobacteriales bacterium]
MSCDGKPDIYASPEAPTDLLSQEKYTQVLMEMQMLEATLKLKLIRKNDIQQRIPGYFEEIFDKHNVTEAQFKSSIDFYNAQPLKTAEVYDSIEQRLIRKKEALDDSSLEEQIEQVINEKDTTEKRRKHSLQLDPQYEK